MQTRINSQTTTTWLTRVCDLSNIRRNLIKFTTVSCCARLVRRRRGQINLFSYIVLFQQGLKWRASTQHRLQDDRHASPLSVVTCVVSISLRSSSVARSRADFWAQTFQDITFNTFSKNIYNFLWPSGVHIVCRELSGVFSWLYSLSFHYRISSPSKKKIIISVVMSSSQWQKKELLSCLVDYVELKHRKFERGLSKTANIYNSSKNRS